MVNYIGLSALVPGTGTKVLVICQNNLKCMDAKKGQSQWDSITAIMTEMLLGELFDSSRVPTIPTLVDRSYTGNCRTR